MLQYDPRQGLPTAAELPDSDGVPVDNELQILVPTLLHAILDLAWARRTDWFFGLNMGLYYHPNRPAVVPDGFLAVGARSRPGEQGRLSYVLWEENGLVPQFVLEVVSRSRGDEYKGKRSLYAQLGTRWYAVYNPHYWQRDGSEVLEVYRLEQGVYRQVTGARVWMPEVGLGLGRQRGQFRGWEREWLWWFDEVGAPYPSPMQAIAQERQQVERERQRVEQERQRADRAERELERLRRQLRGEE